MPSTRPALAVVVPVGPREDGHRPLLRLLRDGGHDGEIVLSRCRPVEAGDVDDDGVRTVTGPPGRAAQLNRGAVATTAACLWFLHADSRPARAAVAAAAEFAAARSGRIGWYDLSFLDDGPARCRLNAVGANLRSRWLGLPFGDQGLLVPRTVFEQLNGFDRGFGPGEDLDFVVRARAAGFGLQPMGVPLPTSARRYRESGWLRTTLTRAWLTLRLWRRASRDAGARRA